jgi:hypothetical protein
MNQPIDNLNATTNGRLGQGIEKRRPRRQARIAVALGQTDGAFSRQFEFAPAFALEEQEAMVFSQRCRCVVSFKMIFR